MTENFELLDIGQIEIMHQQSHDRLDAGDNCDDIRVQHDSLAAELVKRGLPHDTAIICPEVITDAPNYRRGFTDEICTQCAFGQLFPLCNLYDFDYTGGYTCDSFRYFEVLELDAPHGYLMLSGKQTAIASVNKLDINKPKLIISKGEAFGIAELDEPAQVKTKEFDNDEWQRQHRVTSRERRQWWPDSETFYVYRLKQWYSFGKSKVYEDRKVIENVKLTAGQWQQVNKGKELPKQIMLVENAVSIVDDSTFMTDPQVGYSQELFNILRATFEHDVEFNTNGEKQYQIPIYSLALVRNHKTRPITPKKSEKQEGEVMPFRIRKRDDEYCVVKVDSDDSDGESQGCHDTESEAEAQLTALNINVTAEEERSAHPRKKKPKKKDVLHLDSNVNDDDFITLGTDITFDVDIDLSGKQFSVDEYPSKLRRQFQNKFNLDGRDIQPLEIFSADNTPNFAGFIITNKDGGLFKVDFMTNDLGTTFADETMWIEVVPDFKPKGFTQVATYEKKVEVKIEGNTKGFMDGLRSVAKSLGELITFADGKNKKEQLSKSVTDVMPLFETDVGVMQKEVNGELWHFTWSTNAFEDREEEFFSTKGLEVYVAENETRENKGFFNLWHINEEDGNFNTDFAEKRWQGAEGRFLMESGPYFDNEKGKKAKEFFSKFSEGHPDFAPEGWGCSPEFRYLPEERATGTYENFWITRTSTLPKMAAANLWTDMTQARHKMTDMAKLSDSQKESAIAIWGDSEVENMIAEAKKRTAELEGRVANKEIGKEGEKQEDTKPKIDINMAELADEIGKRFQTDINPLSEALEDVKHMIVELSGRVKAVEKYQGLKDLTETPSYIVSLRASDNEKTIVTEDDELSKKAPLGAQNQDIANVTPGAFFDKSR